MFDTRSMKFNGKPHRFHLKCQVYLDVSSLNCVDFGYG